MWKILFIILFLLLINQNCEFKAIRIVLRQCAEPTINASIKIIGRDKNIIGCIPCQRCPAGKQTYFPCGSTIAKKVMFNLECSFCPKGTYSDSYSSSPCKRCKRCGRGSIARRRCTPTTDTECVPKKGCKPGFYFSDIVIACLPCSRCCDDGNDIKIEECATKGSQSKKLCSVHSIHRCLKDFDNENSTTQSVEKRISYDLPLNSMTTTSTSVTTNISGNFSRTRHWGNKNVRKLDAKELPRISVILLSVFLCILILLLTLLVLIKYTRKNSEAECFRLIRLLKSETIPDRCKGDQSDELEDWSNNDISNSTYSFRCGVTIKYDPNCKQDRYKNLIVELLSKKCVDSHLISIKTGEIFLSPIYRFYSKGEKFENQVKISLPHSALWTSEKQNWEIDILCMDERKGKEAKWEKITGGLEINWKDVSFSTDTLLTYAVVGKPLKGAKKRMQFVLFTTAEMISDRFEVCIYLLDDNESSFQNVLKENSLKGLTMLGSFYAAFVDCYNSVDINLNIEGLLDGWELTPSSQKSIPSSVSKESYFSIPSFQATFRRVKRHADKFSCKFKINVAENEIIIPAFTFVPEEELCVVVDVHDQVHDTSFIKEKTSLFKDLHYDTKYVAGRILDVSVKGQGTWRQLGRHFGLADDVVEQFSVEYRTLEGSPSRALFDYLSNTQPNLAVGEFAKCLESLGREDVLAVLHKPRKVKKPANYEA